MCLYIHSPLSLSLSLREHPPRSTHHIFHCIFDIYRTTLKMHISVGRGPVNQYVVPFGLWKIFIFGSIESWNGFCFENIGHGKEKSSLLFIHFCYFCESCLTFKIFVFGFVVGFGFCKLNCTAHWLESDGFFPQWFSSPQHWLRAISVIDNHLQILNRLLLGHISWWHRGVCAHCQWHSSEPKLFGFQEQRIKEAIENWPLNPASGLTSAVSMPGRGTILERFWS